MAKWSQLPPELLEVIANRMESSICTLRFRSVCTAWRAAVKPPDLFINPFPILPTNGFESLFGGFYLSKRTIFLLSLPPNSSRNINSNVCPSYWMIKTGGISPGISHLFYPLSRTHVEPLPASFPNAIDLLNTRVHELGQEYVLEYVNHVRSNDYSSLYMEKVAFLSQKNLDCFLLTIHISGKIAMFRSADKKWDVIDEMQAPYDDVIVFNGKFYAVDNNGRTVVVGFDGADTMTLVAKPVFGGDRKCLVKSGQDLLLVDIYNTIPIIVDDADHYYDGHGDADLDEHIRPIYFEVFKLDRNGQDWIKLESMKDRILFLGDNCSFSASASDLYWCKGNCIWYNFNDTYPSFPYEEQDDPFRCSDVKIFDLDDKSTHSLVEYRHSSKLFWPLPSWITWAS